jgi:TRAP-type C4-dicarboxylate transport system substrate-binding protein
MRGIIMSKRLIVGAAVLAAGLASSSAWSGETGKTEAEVMKNLSLAQKWLSGELESYGNAPVSYDGPAFTMTTSHHIPKVSGLAKVHLKAFRVLEKMSNGKIKVKDTWSKTIHGARDGRKAVRTGLSDYAPCFPAYNARDYDLLHGLGLPFLFNNAHEATAVSEELYAKYLKKKFERFKGVKLARASQTAAYHLYTKKPVRTLEGVKGLKVRAGGGPHAKIIAALGAVPVSMPAADAYTAMQRGTLDAYHINDAVAPIFKVQEVTDYRTVNGFNFFPVFYCTSAAFYEKLPRDLQVVFNNWSRQFAQIEAQGFYEINGAKAIKKMTSSGALKLIDVPASEMKQWQAAVAPVTESWIAEMEKKGLPGKQFIADIRKLSKKYAGMSPNAILQATIDTPLQGILD